MVTDEFLHKINCLQRKGVPGPASQSVSFSASHNIYVIDGEQSPDEVDGLLGGVALVMRVDELLVIRGGFSLDVAVLEGHQDVEADVVPSMAPTLGQLELFDVFSHLLRPN